MHEITLHITGVLITDDVHRTAKATKDMRFAVLPRIGDSISLGSLTPSVKSVTHVQRGSDERDFVYEVSLGGATSRQEDLFERGIQKWRDAGFDVSVSDMSEGGSTQELAPTTVTGRARSLLDEITVKSNVHGRDVLLVNDVDDAVARLEKALGR